MKTKYLVSLILSLVLIVPSMVSAQAESSSLNYSEVKELHGQIFELVYSGKEDQVQNLPLYQEYQDLFEKNPDIESKYLLDLKANKPGKETKEVLFKGNKTYEIYEDGSFTVLTSTINATPVNSGGITPFGGDTGEQYYTATSGHTYNNDGRYDIWGTHKTAELHLTTSGKIYSTYATIENTSTAGTSSTWPGNIAYSDHETVTNNARKVQSKADFTYTVTCPQGWGTCATENIQMVTYVEVKYAGNGSITFTTRTVTTGI